MEDKKKFVCTVCGHVEEVEGDQLEEGYVCPLCGVDASLFVEQK